MVIITIFPLTELKAYIRKLDHETSDLKFLNNQYVHKVRSLEQDSKAKTERILQLQEKNMQAVVQTPGWYILFNIAAMKFICVCLCYSLAIYDQ